MSDEFHKFFDRTTRLMERAMCEDHQSLFVDYTGILPEYLEFKFWDFLGSGGENDKLMQFN